MILNRQNRATTTVIGLACVCVAWEIGAQLAAVPAYVLPRPSHIISYFVSNWRDLVVHTWWTASEGILGVSTALIIGLATAVILTIFRTAGAGLRPAVVALQSTPVLAIAPIVVAWLGPGFFSKATLAAVVCLPVIVVTIADGLDRISPDELDLFSTMNASKWQVLLYLRLPRAIPSLWLAIEIALPLGMLGAIVGEFVGASRGLGFVIMRSSYYLETTAMFGAVIVAGGFSLLMVSVARYCARKTAY